MEVEIIKPTKAVVLSGKRTDPQYSLRIQLVQHPHDQDIKRCYAVHKFPNSSAGEAICLSTYGNRCPICDAITLGGEPFPHWNAKVKKFAMFYGICLSDKFVRDQCVVDAGELTLWIMLENDYKFVDQVISQRKSSAYKSTSYIFDVTINPSANFQKNERRCAYNFVGESQVDLPTIFTETIPPLNILNYSSKSPNDTEMKNLIAAYIRIPNRSGGPL